MKKQTLHLPCQGSVVYARLFAQIVGLERRTARGGRDSVDHAPGAQNDVDDYDGPPMNYRLVVLSWARARQLRELAFSSEASSWLPYLLLGIFTTAAMARALI
jgi:hypothetical protein